MYRLIQILYLPFGTYKVNLGQQAKVIELIQYRKIINGLQLKLDISTGNEIISTIKLVLYSQLTIRFNFTRFNVMLSYNIDYFIIGLEGHQDDY